jgi:hypothetical protein
MASPKLEVFFLYNATTGAPLTGQTGLTFTSYKNDLGTNLAQPTISELGGGAYGFTPVFADLARGITYLVNTNGAVPAYFSRFMRPEDWNDPAGTPRFMMRAWRFVPTTKYVYWTVTGAPDLSGAQAPSPEVYPDTITDIVVAYTYPT